MKLALPAWLDDQLVQPPRILHQLSSRVLCQDASFSNSIFLTFDDGPHPHYTEEVLAILKDFQALASFFVVGERVREYPDVVRRTVAAGHTIGGHGYRHRRLIFKSVREYENEVSGVAKTIHETTGGELKFFRPPYGLFGPGLLQVIKALNLKLVLWSVLPFDYHDATSPHQIVRRVFEHLHGGAVVLLHDGHRNSEKTIHALPRILEAASQKGFSFAPLDALQGSVK